jgi:predicted ArsR family transcriptional regulator
MTDHSEVAISHLQRRKIEGRVLIPFLQAVAEKFGEAAMHEVLDATIRNVAAADGAAWAKTFGRTTTSMRQVAEDVWAGGGATNVQVMGEADDRLDFNVTRCGYAEFYKQMGLAELGYRIHCSRDHAAVAGFNDQLELSRSQTIMQGAPCCDFRFRKKAPA